MIWRKNDYCPSAPFGLVQRKSFFTVTQLKPHAKPLRQKFPAAFGSDRRRQYDAAIQKNFKKN
jgi:hypothetical protein